MSFLAPLAFAFATALPVVIVFYLLKRRRTTRLVSSTLLWQKFLAETQANAPFQKLRHNWLLILQLLLLALVVLALARPFLGGTTKPARLKVLILDASASMQATDEKPTRFEKARAEALKLVDGLRDGEQMMLLLAGASTEVRQSATSDKLALRRALEACAASDGRARVTEALEMAAAFTVEKRGEGTVAAGEIHLFSDGAVGSLGSFENKTLPLTFHRVGQRADNLGIIALDVRANPDNAAQRAVFATVANFSSNVLSSELELRFDDQIVEAHSVKLEPKQKLPLVFTVNQPRDGIFTLRLTTADDLPVDNQASVVSLLPQPVKVLLVSRGNRFLERALRAAGNIELNIAQTFATSAPGVDVVVLDDVLPAVWPEGNVLAINTATTNLFTNWSRHCGLERHASAVALGELRQRAGGRGARREAAALGGATGRVATDAARARGRAWSAARRVGRLRHAAKHLAAARVVPDLHRQRRRVAQPGLGAQRAAHHPRRRPVPSHAGRCARHGAAYAAGRPDAGTED
jgi:Ca-activated chloride channel family protein